MYIKLHDVCFSVKAAFQKHLKRNDVSLADRERGVVCEEHVSEDLEMLFV